MALTWLEICFSLMEKSKLVGQLWCLDVGVSSSCCPLFHSHTYIHSSLVWVTGPPVPYWCRSVNRKKENNWNGKRRKLLGCLSSLAGRLEVLRDRNRLPVCASDLPSSVAQAGPIFFGFPGDWWERRAYQHTAKMFPLTVYSLCCRKYSLLYKYEQLLFSDSTRMMSCHLCSSLSPVPNLSPSLGVLRGALPWMVSPQFGMEGIWGSVWLEKSHIQKRGIALGKWSMG